MLQMAIANEFNRSMLTVDETHLQASQDIYDLLNQSTLNVVVDEEVVRLHILADRCMYVFDEIDRVLVRDGMMGSLLSEIDGLTNHGGRIIVATTNHFDRIPEELCRNGRLYPIPCTLVTPAQAPLFLRPFFEAAAVDAYCPRIEQWIVQERRAPSPALLKQWIQTHLTDLDAVMHAWASMRPLSEEEYAFGFNPALPRPSKLA
jgi:hypothetical protein